MKNNYYFLLLIWMVCITPSAHAVWLSPDPLLDKYPNISPYTYCNNNPIKYVDPDGRNYTINIDNETNTMSISAKYYVESKNVESAQQAIDFWNNQSNQYAYRTKDQQYTIVFDLQLEVVGNVTTALINDPSNNANAYIVRSPIDGNTAGFCAEGNQVVVSPLYQFGATGAHEVGHTLGMLHTGYGIMTPAIDSPGRRIESTKTNISECISNVFMPHAAVGFLNGSLNRHGKVIRLP